MTPDDLAALLRWLYANDDGSGWLPAAARFHRLSERNLRGMLAGKLPIPPVVAEVVLILVACNTFLQGWRAKVEELPRLGLAEQTAERLAYWRKELDLDHVA